MQSKTTSVPCAPACVIAGVVDEVTACVVVAVTDGKFAVEEATACDNRHLQHFWAS